MKHILKHKLNKLIPLPYSLSLQYFLLVLSSIGLLIVLSLYLCYYQYLNCIHERDSEIQSTTAQLYNELNDIFKESDSFLKFLGEKIILRSSDLINTKAILSHTENINIKPMMDSYVSWANPKGDLIVTNQGILTHHIPNISDRHYFISARKNPWTLKFSLPTKSSFSKSDVIPLAMGITNKHNQFIGYLILSIKTKSFNKFLNNILPIGKVSFIVLDDKNNILFNSHPDLNGTLQNKLKFFNFKLLQDQGYLNSLLTTETQQYTYYQKVKDTPYTIITGYNESQFKKTLLNNLYPRFCEILFLFVFTLLIVSFFKSRIIKPILGLSNAAILIAKGQLHTNIPRQKSTEMFILAKSLLLILKHTKRNLLYKEKLEHLSALSKRSDDAKDVFAKVMFRELYSIFYTVKTLIDKFINGSSNHSSVGSYNTTNNITEEALHCIDRIRKTILNIYSMNDASLHHSTFELNQTIQYCVQINLKASLLRHITIETKLYDQELFVYADEIRLQHVIVSLIARSIVNSPLLSTINLSTTIQCEGNARFYNIIIQDQAYNLDDYQLQSIQGKLGVSLEDDFHFGIPILELKEIEKLVNLHHGEYSLEKLNPSGHRINLRFPHLYQNNNVIPFKK